ncbi:MAG TPA: hypothetical protein VM619_02595 [Luteimonas sp.]|nr:hypothetical protein [Luteimonas sp.]
MVIWRRVSWIAGLLIAVVGLVVAYAYKVVPIQSAPQAKFPPLVEILHKEFSPEEYRAIQETFWSNTQGQDRHCAEAFVFAYMDMLRKRCEIMGEAKDIGGGCAHMTNAMNYPEVLEAGLKHCGIKYSIYLPRPNNSFKPKPLRGSA